MSLREQLESEAAKLKGTGKANYRWHYVLTVLAIAASFLASLSVALEWFGKDVLAIVAAVPAAVLATADRLNFDAKTKWYYGKSAALRKIAGAMTYEGLAESDGHKQLSAVDADFEARWPGIGASPK